MREWEREALTKYPLKQSFYLSFFDVFSDTFVDILNHHSSIKVKRNINPTTSQNTKNTTRTLNPETLYD